MSELAKAVKLAEEAGRLRGVLMYIKDRLGPEECQYPDECKLNNLCAICEVGIAVEAALAEKECADGTK